MQLVMRLMAAQFPSTTEAISKTPFTNVTEWELVSLFEDNGFSEIRLECPIDVWKEPPMRWEVFVDLSPHPLAPTLREIMASEFTTEEAMRLEASLRPSVEAGARNERDSIAYLTALKPG